jgi:hypothetical protein
MSTNDKQLDKEFAQSVQDNEDGKPIMECNHDDELQFIDWLENAE